MNLPAIRDAGDSAVLLELDAVIDRVVNARAIGIATAIADRRLTGVRDVIPTYRSVAVHFDPLAIDVEVLMRRDARCHAKAHARAQRRARSSKVPVLRMAATTDPICPRWRRSQGCPRRT